MYIHIYVYAYIIIISYALFVTFEICLCYSMVGLSDVHSIWYWIVLSSHITLRLYSILFMATALRLQAIAKYFRV